jgi:hypothetical protein
MYSYDEAERNGGESDVSDKSSCVSFCRFVRFVFSGVNNATRDASLFTVFTVHRFLFDDL